MRYPDAPTCHAKAPHFALASADEWRTPSPGDPEAGPFGYPYRTCSYCGSIHPEDLVAYLRRGSKLDPADQKYGWPHKYYVTRIPNPLAGQQVRVGMRSVGAGLPAAPVYGLGAEHTPAKFYTRHLLDEGYDDEALQLVLRALSSHTRYLWHVYPERGLGYRPHRAALSVTPHEDPPPV